MSSYQKKCVQKNSMIATANKKKTGAQYGIQGQKKGETFRHSPLRQQ